MESRRGSDEFRAPKRASTLPIRPIAFEDPDGGLRRRFRHRSDEPVLERASSGLRLSPAEFAYQPRRSGTDYVPGQGAPIWVIYDDQRDDGDEDANPDERQYSPRVRFRQTPVEGRERSPPLRRRNGDAYTGRRDLPGSSGNAFSRSNSGPIHYQESWPYEKNTPLQVDEMSPVRTRARVARHARLEKERIRLPHDRRRRTNIASQGVSLSSTGEYLGPVPVTASARIDGHGTRRRAGDDTNSRYRERAFSHGRAASSDEEYDYVIEADDYESEEPVDSETDDDLYSFTLSRRTKSIFSIDSDSVDSYGLETEQRKLLPAAKDPLPSGALRYVFDSRFITENGGNGDRRLQLLTTEKPNRNLPPLYRWLHLKNSKMRFSDFQTQVAKIDGLTTAEQRAIARLLGRVQSELNERSQNGKIGQTRAPKTRFFQESFEDVSQTVEKLARPQKVLWLCLPYFCLAGYSKANAPTMRTLLQMHYSTSSHQDHDIRQAVRGLPNVPSNHGFHVAQVWCLILDDSLLVTCAPVDASLLLEDGVRPLPEPDVSKIEPQRVRISVGEGLQYSLVREKCQTWFGLMSHLAEFWPRQTKLTFRGEVVDRDSWPMILKRSEYKHKDLRLELELKDLEPVPSRTDLQNPESKITPKSRSDNSKVVAEHKTNVELVARPHPATSGTQASDAHVEERRAASSPASPPQPLSLAPPLVPSIEGSSVETRQGEHIKIDQAPKAGEDVDEKVSVSEFCAFGWLVAETETDAARNATVNTAKLTRDLAEMNNFFRKRKKNAEHSSYNDCPTASHNTVWILMDQKAKSGKEAQETGPSPRIVVVDGLRRCRVGLFNFAEDLFKFFLPLDFQGPTTSKYWGAVGCLLLPSNFVVFQEGEGRRIGGITKAEKDSFDQSELPDIQSSLERLVRMTEPVRRLLSQMPIKQRRKVKIPDSLITAWLHLVSSLAQCADCSYSWPSDMVNAARLIESGSRQIMHGLTEESVTQKIVLRPTEIASAIVLRLLGDVTSGSSSINNTYTEYTSNLERAVDNDPLNGSHRDTIARLQREVGVALKVLDEQRSAIQMLRTSVKVSKSRSAPSSGKETSWQHVDEHGGSVPVGINKKRLTPTDLGGYHDVLTNNCLDAIDEKADDLNYVIEKSRDLDQQTARRIESNKSQQEAAIYIFTIVTVIFLPLSTVASILGMNTNDVRNMDQDQWVFWVVAVPLVLIVVFLCLKLQGFWPGFTTLWNQGRLRVPFRIVWRAEGDGVAGEGPEVLQERKPRNVLRSKPFYS